MSQSEKIAYFAGIVDGEGSIMLWMDTRSKRINRSYNLRLNVSSTDKCLTDWIHSNFGGKVYELNSPSRKANPQWKKQHLWEASRPDLLNILQSIHPYLVIKKTHCEIAIEFRKTFSKKERYLSDETIKKRHSIFEKMKHLNSRGR